jgi:hypothetical protein
MVKEKGESKPRPYESDLCRAAWTREAITAKTNAHTTFGGSLLIEP